MELTWVNSNKLLKTEEKREGSEMKATRNVEDRSEDAKAGDEQIDLEQQRNDRSQEARW